MNNEKYIKDLRDRCRDKSDHDFIDAMETIITEFEKPREPVDPFKYFTLSPEAQIEWDKALSDYAKEHKFEYFDGKIIKSFPFPISATLTIKNELKTSI